MYTYTNDTCVVLLVHVHVVKGLYYFTVELNSLFHCMFTTSLSSTYAKIYKQFPSECITLHFKYVEYDVSDRNFFVTSHAVHQSRVRRYSWGMEREGWDGRINLVCFD